MWIERLHLNNYRCFDDFEIAFRPGLNVIAGVNGSGKTSLLMGLCQSLSLFTFEYILKQQGDSNPITFFEENQVRLKVEIINNRFRFEPQYPCAITMSAHYQNKKLNLGLKRESAESIITEPRGNAIDFTFNPTIAPDHLPLFPIFVFYPSNRLWQVSGSVASNETQAITGRYARLYGYANWWIASADISTLQTWVISKCLERFQTSSETGLKFDDIHDDELALVNQALSAVLAEAKGLKYDLKQKTLLIEWHEHDGAARPATPFDQLSDGQRSMIALVADIARRMCLLNPQLGPRVMTETPGVVLIDELDMHLHPQWQRLLTRGLKQAFPAVQFIVTSHSPQVLGELQPDEIILLQGAGTAHPQASYGLDSSQILQEIMGADARTGQVQAALDQLFAALEQNQLEQARVSLQQLRAEAPDIPELAGAAALLRRKEVLGR